jgi:hypothetical protein
MRCYQSMSTTYKQSVIARGMIVKKRFRNPRILRVRFFVTKLILPVSCVNFQGSAPEEIAVKNDFLLKYKGNHLRCQTSEAVFQDFHVFLCRSVIKNDLSGRELTRTNSG